MEKFEIYITEIKTLRIKSIGRFIDVDHYSSIQSGYPAELDNLQQHALSELRTLPDEKIQCQLTLLHQLEELFFHFDHNYPQMFMQAQNGLLSPEQVFENLSLIFDDIRLDNDIISVHSLIEIYSAILTKQNSVLNLRNKTEDLLLERTLNELETPLNS